MSHQIPPDPTRSHQIPPDPTRSRQIPPDPARSDSDPQTPPRIDILEAAKAWDAYSKLVYEMRPFDVDKADSLEYREERAVSYFNASVAVKRWLKRFGVAADSWVSHVSMCVTPRQIMADGDQMRRAADAAEAFGAMIKYSLHNLCCRRGLAKATTTHHKVRTSFSRLLLLPRGPHLPPLPTFPSSLALSSQALNPTPSPDRSATRMARS